MKSYNTQNPKLTKRIITLFVVAAMVLTTLLPAFASDDNVVSVSSITFDDGSGNIVQSLDGLDRVRAQVTVKTKASQKMVFVLALYGKNNKLLKIDREEKSATSQGTTFQTIIEYDLPDNAEGYKLNAFLLDSVKSMDAIARGSLFPNGNLELCNLYLTIGDDEPVDLLTVEASKDGNYEIDVPLDIIYAPTVKAVAVDNGTKVEVTPPAFFPGYTDIKLTATNGATKNYRINYSAKSTIESLTGYLGTDFHAADDTEGDYGSPYWSDRTTPATTGANVAYYNDVRTISDEWDYLKGSIYYKAAVGDYVNPSYKSDRSTTVRVFGTSAITGDGWTSATNTDGHITVSHTTGAGVEGHAEYQPALKMTVASSKTFPAGKVTLPAIPKNFIVVVEPAQYVPESHRAFYVNSIEVNGDAIDTSKGPGTYNVPLASDAIYAPEITEEDVAFAEEYSNRTVEITNPSSFPGQSVIKITSGEDSVEYVINYSLDNLLTNTSDNIGTNFHAADDDNAADYSGHLRGSRFFMDRNDTVIWVNNNSSQGVAYYNDIRSINSAYDFLNGSTYFMAAVGTKPNTKFTVGRAADVYAFTIAGGTYSGAEGWTKTENSEGFMTFSSTLGQGVGTGAPGKMTVLYHKSLEAGDSVSITPSQREAIVVVKFKGYIEKGVTLTDLKVDGETIPGFASDRNEYTVELPADTLISPKVTAEADDEQSVVEVLNPGDGDNPATFPGKAIVNVTYGNKTKQYIVNYKAKEALLTATTSNYRTGFCAADDANANVVGGVKVGSQLYADRSCPVYVANNPANGIAYYNDIRSIADDWDYLNGADYFISAIGNRTATFKLNRDAVVRVFSSGANAISETDGWEKETDASGYVISSTTTGEDAVKFTSMFYKSFKAGDTVTVTPAVKESITVIDYIGYVEAASVLESITVNGKEVEGFNMSQTEYTVEIGADTLTVPTVQATPVVDGATVEITNPGEGNNPMVFPGKVIIKVTNGDTESIYTITYTAGDLISSPSRDVGKNFRAADDANANEVGGEKVGSQLYSDRPSPAYVANNPANGVAYYNDIRAISTEWDYLNGTDYFMSAVGAGARPVTFTLERAATVRVFSDGTNAMSTTDGWINETKADGYIIASTTSGHMTAENSNKFTQMFYKKFSAGDTVTVSPATQTAVTVIDYIGYVDAAAALTDISVDGVSIDGFDMTKTEYNVEIDSATLVLPEVTATALSDNAVVEVINPGEGDNPNVFPGKVIINVCEGDTENQYIVNYVAGDLISDNTKTVGKDFHAADDANAVEVGGYKVGSPLFSDRTTPVTNAAGLAYFNDIRTIADDWDYLNGADYFSSAVGARSVTFTLNRAAVVRVFSQGTASMSTDDGWTRETDNNGYMTASTTSGQGITTDNAVFGNMFYKEFSAGDTVTVSPTAKESIIVIDYAGYVDAAAALTDVSVDGVSIDGFDMTKTEYNVEIDSATLVLPEVTATALSDNAVVEVINPGEGDNPNVFPGKVIINVTEGDEENQYIVNYVAGDLISSPSRDVGKNFRAADDANANEVGGEKVGSQLYSDRPSPAYVANNPANGVAYYNDIRAISAEWDYLNGTDYFMSAVGAGARPVTFTLERAATVRVFSDGTNAMSTTDGWIKETKADGYIIASTTTGHMTAENSNKFTQMFYKKFSAGDTVTVSPATQTAVTVIDYLGYVDAAAALTDISVDGVSIDGFDMTKTEYNVEIDSATLVLPEVTATALSDNAVVEVINPGEGDNPNVFPGKVIINVCEGDTENQYIVNYVAGDLITGNTKTVGKDFHAADDANAVEVGGYKVGSPLFSDRTTPVTNAAGLAYFNDIRTIADDWDYLNGADYFSSAVGARNVTFTLNRAAVVRVFSQGTASMSTDDGWTRETDNNGYMTASTTSGQGITTDNAVFGNMFYKEFSAGDTVTVSPTAKESIIVIDYAGYGEQTEETEETAALTDISIDGESIPDFDSENYEYDVDIAPDTVVLPEITATALSDNAIVEVINPGEGDNPNVFPGKVIINVTEGNAENQYIINYVCEPTSVITGMTSSNGGSFLGTNFHEPGDFGETYGSKLFYDRASPATNADGIAYYNDVHEICDEMDYLKSSAYIMANRNQGANINHTFTLLRPATVRIFHLTGYNSGNETLTDWTTETKTGGFVKVSHTLGAGVVGHANYVDLLGLGAMTYKEFAAGDEVSVNSPGDHAIVVIDFAGYEIN